MTETPRAELEDLELIEDPEVQPASGWFRMLLGITIPLAATAAVLALLRLRTEVENLDYLALTEPDAAAEGILILGFRFFAAVAVVLGLVGAWYVVVAWKTLRSERYPPAGIPVAFDTEIRRDRSARLRGMVGLFLASLLLLLALLLPTFGPRMLYDGLRPALEAWQ